MAVTLPTSGIDNQIQRITARVSSAYSAVANKGGTIPSEKNIDNLPSAISSIAKGFNRAEVQLQNGEALYGGYRSLIIPANITPLMKIGNMKYITIMSSNSEVITPVLPDANDNRTKVYVTGATLVLGGAPSDPNLIKLLRFTEATGFKYIYRKTSAATVYGPLVGSLFTNLAPGTYFNPVENADGTWTLDFPPVVTDPNAMVHVWGGAAWKMIVWYTSD